MVPASAEPVSVPLKVPFMRTMPDGSPIETGPVIAVPFCESTHVMRPSVPLTVTDPFQVPPIWSVVGPGAVVELDSAQPGRIANPSSNVAARICCIPLNVRDLCQLCYLLRTG